MRTKQNNEMPNEHLHGLFVDELKDILSAEKQLVNALKKMNKQASSKELQEAFSNHLKQTETHVDRLRQVFELLGLSARSKTCKAMQGLLAEADEIIADFEDDPAKDAALIAAAQKVEHYEIATYGTLVTYANLMGHKEPEKLLQQTLNEEKLADSLLTEIAMTKANINKVA